MSSIRFFSVSSVICFSLLILTSICFSSSSAWYKSASNFPTFVVSIVSRNPFEPAYIAQICASTGTGA
jgi:hypothetical protein